MALIYVADDDTGLRDIFSTWLEKQGHTVVKASNGEEAYEHAAASDELPDLLITDIMMPNIDGGDAAFLFSHMEKSIPVLVISACSDAHKIERITEQPNVKAFIRKPVPHDQFIETVNRLLA